MFDVANNNNTAVRIRTLLSKMFEKAWQAGVGEQTDEKTVLKHIISWPSFHRFLGLFCKLVLLFFFTLLQTVPLLPALFILNMSSLYYSLASSQGDRLQQIQTSLLLVWSLKSLNSIISRLLNAPQSSSLCICL